MNINEIFFFFHSVIYCYIVLFSYADSNGVHIMRIQENLAGHKESSSQVRGKVLLQLHT